MKNNRRIFSALAGALALIAAGTASAATLVIEAAPGHFIAEAFPNGSGYQYTFSTTPNIIVDAVWDNVLTGHCMYNVGYGTVYVTVTYPNGHVESTQRGVRCNFGPNEY